MIAVKTFTTKETIEYQHQKYEEFLNLYFNTEKSVTKIIREEMGLNEKSSAVKYIRRQMRMNGYNAHKRIEAIKKGEWLK